MTVSLTMAPLAMTMQVLRTTPVSERAAATPLLIAAVVLVAVLFAGVSTLGGAATARARADAVADVTALAAVGGGADAARHVATTSGAEAVNRLTWHGTRATVEVVVEGVVAVAAAAPLGPDVGHGPDPPD